jgi:hypothetical protein
MLAQRENARYLPGVPLPVIEAISAVVWISSLPLWTAHDLVIDGHAHGGVAQHVGICVALQCSRWRGCAKALSPPWQVLLGFWPMKYKRR